MNLYALYPYLKLDPLSGFIALAISLFTVLALVYSFGFMKDKKNLKSYYTYIIFTAVSSLGVVFANDLRSLLVLWGFLGITLYLLISMGSIDSDKAAKKTFIIVGGSDAIMLLGVAIIYRLSGTFQMDKISLNTQYLPDGQAGSMLSIFAYLCIALACFAKAGAMPMHSWIPDCAESAPVPVVAYLPASLDKLLGIYLLARASLNLFVMSEAMNIFLMLTGAFTIIAAVMMALVQHNMKRLLGYHAVSQVGYMVLGIGTGNPIGIAGGIFHMLNHAVYKSCLFFTAGNVESEAKTTELSKLGGLAKFMPITYISCLIASLSISGIPPFNGFVSKWMIYQGIINLFQAESCKLQAVSVLCLIAAMFGSSLTLASFMKLIHAVFLGQPASRPAGQPPEKEVSWLMRFPCLLLAAVCVIFGVFAYQIPLRYFILPSIKGVVFSGVWFSGLATLLIVIGFILGVLIFKIRNLGQSIRQDGAFTGGEYFDKEEEKITGAEFYNTVKELGLLKRIYKKAEEGLFDIYEQGKRVTFSFSDVLKRLHNGILPTYLVWCLLGMLGLFYLMSR